MSNIDRGYDDCRFINMFISTWVLLVAGLVFALPMIHLRVKNHTDLADETLCVLLPFSSHCDLY